MALRHVILTLLHQRPATGYELVKEFDTVVGYFWSASHQQVYRDLGKLAEEGLVRFTVVPQDERPDRKVYQLTEEGEAALREWIESPIQPRKLHDELLVRLLAGELVGSVALRSLLASQQALRQGRLEEYRRIEEEHFADTGLEALPPVHQLACMMLRLGIRGEEAWLEWAEELDRVLERMEG
ncbi:MAG: PadR family transcriptional regulator [Gemmatimonadota bacterium]